MRHSDLKIHPYRIQVVQELKPSDYMAQHFCERMMEKINDNPDFLKTFSCPVRLLRGNLISKVYTTRPTTIAELKTSIREEITAIPMEVFQSAMQNVSIRFQE